MDTPAVSRIGVLTSGGDSQGMNAAIRAVVRAALERDIDVFAIYEGYQGMYEGGEYIRKMDWNSVGGIMQRGGTEIGTARSAAFRKRDGLLAAARNLIERGIDHLVVVGGDGSLSGANEFREEWPGLIAELAETGKISRELAEQHPNLYVVGLVGSIDNDMYGTDMTIGADSALHRITEAIDSISSTAASHQRTFVVEVMGRNCGYLALMAGISGGADWVFIPENPPDLADWESRMCEILKAGRKIGRRDSVVIVAEGARDRDGNPIHADYVKQVLEQRLGEDTRVTILGHVQRGGSPSAFDRWMSTLVGCAAVDEVLAMGPDSESMVMGIRENRITRYPLMAAVEETRAVAKAIAAKEYDRAMEMRGGSFSDAFRTLRTLVRALPHEPVQGQRRLRLAVMTASGAAPGMNTAVRAAVRLGIDKGHTMLGIESGFRGLMEDKVRELTWTSVSGWNSIGGSELGTSRFVPAEADLPTVAATLRRHNIEGILMIGGWAGYQSVYRLQAARDRFAEFGIPMICLPATIDNDLPGSEISVGADTALNNIIEAVDKIKQSAVASFRTFIVEVMGGYCGYLALMSGLASGAERVYLHEEGVTLDDLQKDVRMLLDGFQNGKRLALLIRNEKANRIYTTGFMQALFEEAGGSLFEVRQSILGHLQQGGNPSPFDRIQATRLAARSVEYLIAESENESPGAAMIGLMHGHIDYTPIVELPAIADMTLQRVREQWWLDLMPRVKMLAQSGPHGRAQR
ncbi:6-phosphofructokinase [Chloroflexia bacterium SDU3-3]|nr:6-phosphofructokinase [Chloroflexia bacterium SDU3-3]